MKVKSTSAHLMHRANTSRIGRERTHHNRTRKPAFELLETRCLLAFSVVGSDAFSTGGLRLVVDFNQSVDPSTVDAADLVVDGLQTATSANVVDADTVEFFLPALGSGTRTVTIELGAILNVQGTNLEPFSQSLAVASASQYTVKHNPRLQPGDAPLVGYAGSELDRVDILWQTIPASTGTQDSFSVEYRPASAAAWQTASLNTAIDTGVAGRVVRSATITGLDWNSDYEYRVRHRQADVISGQYQSTFHSRLAAGDDSAFSFVAYGDSASGAATGFRQVQSRINQVSPSFAVLLGDNVYSNGSHKESDARFSPIVNPEAAAWMAGHIDYLGLGNHDIGTSSGLPSEQNYSVPIPVAGVTAPAAPPATERAEHSFSWDYGDVHFVTFDTNSKSDPTRLDGLLKWVIADLNASTARWKIVYGHHPLAGVPDKTDEPGDNYYQQVVNQLKGAGVDLFMTGHSHTYSWTYPLTGQINGVATYADHGVDDHFHAGEGLTQLVSGVGGHETRGGDYSQFPFVAAGFSDDTPVPSRRGFSKIDVTQNTLTASYIAADDGAVIDSFQIEKEVTQTASFQQDVNGYSGTVDTFLHQNAPDTSNATVESLKVDNDDPVGTGLDAQTLLGFDNLFGSGPGHIPSNATLRTATLQLQVTSSNANNMNLHRMQSAWSDADTWNSLADGVQTDGVEAVASPDTSSGQSQVGQLSFNVLSSLQAWQADPDANRGWALIPTGTEGVDFDSSEGTTKPKLIVTYVLSVGVPDLSLTLSASSMSENGGEISGTITRNTSDVSQSLTVDLSSNDTSEATVPATVTIPANQAAADFIVTAVDDNLLDGTQPVTITGSAAGHGSGTKSINVTDHESLAVTINPGAISENGGTATGTVTRSNTDNAAALVVNLSSNDTSEATVPATVTIPVNQAAANFTITAVNDGLLDGAQTVTITASAASYVAGTQTIEVTDDGTLVVIINLTSISENGGSAIGTVIRNNFDIGSDLIVNLASNDVSEATVPATVTIPANQSAANFNISAIDDSLLDGKKTATITASATGYVTGSKTLEVTDFETLAITIDLTSLSENGGTATGTVGRGNTDNSAALTVNLVSSDPSEATVSGSVTIAANQASANFTITAVDDNLLDGTQTPTITASMAGYISGTKTINVTDHETLTVTINPGAMRENSGTATGTVTRSNTNNTAPLVVNLSSNDTSEATVPATVTIPVNQAAANFTITAVNDELLDGAQTVTVTASAASYVAGTQTIEVTDDGALVVTINLTSISENGGSAIGTVIRNNFDIGSDLIVNLASNDVSEATVPATVTIPANQSAANFNISAIDDTLLDGKKSATITASATGYVTGSGTLEVTDFETLAITIGLTSMSESGGTATGIVTRSNSDTFAVLVVALASNDMGEAIVPGTVTIAANQASANFTITAVDDNLLDGTQTPTITASRAGYVSGTKTIDVTDHETLTVTIDPRAVGENGGTATGTVTRSNANKAAPLVVNLSSNDTSEANVPATVTIPGNQAAANFTITAVNDALLDGAQTVTITASAASYVAGTQTIEVTDDATLFVTFNLTSISENGGSAIGTVIRNNFDIGSDLIVNLTSNDTSEATVPATVTIPANQSVANFIISAVDDTLLDGKRIATISATADGYISGQRSINVTDLELLSITVDPLAMNERGGIAIGTVTRNNVDRGQLITVTLISADPSELLVPSTVFIIANQQSATFVVRATDDTLLDGTQIAQISAAADGYESAAVFMDVTDYESLTLTLDAAAMSESGGSVIGTVTRSNTNLEEPLVVDLSGSDPTAATVPVSVTIAANQASANFTITAVNDNLLDGTQTPTFTASTAGYVSGTKTIDVTDHETLTVTVSLGVINENGGSAIGTVIRNNFDIGSDLIVNLTSNDTSEARVPATVTIPANQSVANFIISAVDDTLLDGTRTATISATADGYVSGQRSINVTDHELLSITVNPPAMSERGGIAIGTVTRNNADRGQLITVTLISADPSELLVPSTVVIIANQQSATFVVSAADDTLLDGTQTAQISAAADGYESAAVFLDVTDYESLTLTLDAAAMSESGGSVIGTVTRSNTNLEEPLVVGLTGSDPSAATIPAQVTIAANQSSATFNISAVDDTLLDGMQTFTITAAAVGYQSVFKTLNITDRELAPIITSPNEFMVAENSMAVGTVTAIDDDPPPHELRFSIVGGADRSHFTMNPQTGELLFIAPPDFESPNDVGSNHDYDLVVGVRDVTGLIGTQSLQVHVTAVNDQLPRFTSPPGTAIEENMTAVLKITAADGDLPAQAVTIAIVGGTDAGRFRLNASSRELTFADPPDFEVPSDSNEDNEYEVQLEVVDSEGGESTQALRVTVRGVNEAPAWAAQENQRFDEKTPFRLSLTGTDPDEGDLLTYALVSGNQPGMSLSAATGEFQWTTTETQDGIYSVVFQVRDQGGLVSPNQEITIQVDDVNSTPTLTSLVNRAVAEHSSLEFTLSAIDRDSVAGMPNSISFAIADGNQPGMTLNRSTGTVRWTPGETQDGSFVVMFTAHDGSAASSPQSMTITVTENNEAPTLTNPGNRSLDERMEIVVALSASDRDVIAGVADPFSYALVSGSLPGMTLNNSTGEFRWTPGEMQDGIVSVAFQAFDAHNATSIPQTITLTVRDLNEAPILSVPENVVSDEETLVSFSLMATDGDFTARVADSVVFTMLSSELPGMTLNRATGALRWLPSESQDGIFALIFQATDNQDQKSAQQTMTVTVVEKNEAPVFDDPGEQDVVESTPLLLALTATDSDRIDGVAGALNYQLVAGLVPGMTLDSGTGMFRWTPSDTQTGRHVVVFRAIDQQGLNSNQQSVTITVRDSNRPPTAIELIPASVDENASGAVVGRLDVTDPDAEQTHSFTIDDTRFEVVGQQLQLQPTVQLDFETEPIVAIVVTARDPGTRPQSVTKTFTVAVRDVNDPPTRILLSSQTALENLSGVVIGTLSVEDQDADQVHTFTVTDSRFEIAETQLRLKPDQALNLDDGGEIVLEIIARDSGVPQMTLKRDIVLSVITNARPWQNQAQPSDVTRDSRIVPLDALIVINLINNPTWLGSGGQLPGLRPADSQLPFYDVNGDGFCTSNDALRIINSLNIFVGEGEDSRGFIAWVLPAATAPEAEPFEGLGRDHAVSVSTAPLPRASTGQPVRPIAERLSLAAVVPADAFDARQDSENRLWEDFESLLDNLADNFCRHTRRDSASE